MRRGGAGTSGGDVRIFDSAPLRHAGQGTVHHGVCRVPQVPVSIAEKIAEEVAQRKKSAA